MVQTIEINKWPNKLIENYMLLYNMTSEIMQITRFIKNNVMDDTSRTTMLAELFFNPFHTAGWLSLHNVAMKIM